MMTSSIHSITFDCADPARLAAFWAAAVSYVVEDADDEGASVVAPSGSSPRLLFLKVPEGKSVKNRVHLDLRPANSMQAEVERLEKLGASVPRFVEEDGSRFTVMRDPEGNEFCVERGPQDMR
jgi:predicted enzyme related to lactoylglutathione lyase